jgi:hypothetical protein
MRIILFVLIFVYVASCSRSQPNSSTAPKLTDTPPPQTGALMDRNSLNALLLSRIGPPWDSQVELYINILAETGDYAVADRLAAISEDPKSKMASQRELAVRTILKRRDQEVMGLDAVHRKQWNDQLVADIPGRWDIVSVENIRLLGQIGDQTAANKLRSLLDNKDNMFMSGLLVKPIEGAIQKIEQRADKPL